MDFIFGLLEIASQSPVHTVDIEVFSCIASRIYGWCFIWMIRLLIKIIIVISFHCGSLFFVARACYCCCCRRRCGRYFCLFRIFRWYSIKCLKHHIAIRRATRTFSTSTADKKEKRQIIKYTLYVDEVLRLWMRTQTHCYILTRKPEQKKKI